jgi:hypothetical protein
MIRTIQAHAERLGMSRGTLLVLAREAAQDATLRSIAHMSAEDQANLAFLLSWIEKQDAELLIRTSRFHIPHPKAA